MKTRAKLIPAVGGGKVDPPQKQWEVMLFNALTTQEIANAVAFRDAYPDEEASVGYDAAELVKQPSPAAFLGGAWDEDLHPRGEHGKFGEKDGGVYGDFTAVKSTTVSGDTQADAAARVDATIKLEALLPGASINLGTLDGDLAPQLVESVGRAVGEFPALHDTISSIQITEMTDNVMGGYLPSTGEMVFNSSNFGTSAIEPRQVELDTEMNPSGSFHPLDDAQSTFDHEIGHAVWEAAQRDMSKALDPNGIGGGWNRLNDREMSMKLLGFDPNLVANKGFTGYQSPRAPESEWRVPTRQITGAMRSMGSKYGSLSYMMDNIEGGYVETSRSLNEGFAEWFSVRQREPMRDGLESRTKPIIGDAFAQVVDHARSAQRAAALAAVSDAPRTCYGYVSAERWASMSKAEQDALFPPVDESQLAGAWDEDLHPRGEHGRFGEGGDAGRSLLQTVRTTGGATISPLDGSSPTTGFVVARPDIKGDIVKADDFFDPVKGPAAIVAFMEAHPEGFDEPGEYLGLWHDTAHGEVALDAVEVMADRDAAIAAGAGRDEQAIWDVEQGVEIPTGGTGHRAAAATRLRGSHADRTDPPRQAAEAVGRDVGRGEAGVGNVDPAGAGDGAGLSRTDARLLGRLTSLRQQLGTRLLAQAQQAYEAALRSAGVKLINRARSRTSPTRYRQACIAVDKREALAPWLTAVGLTEIEMLDHAFDTFTEQTIAEVQRYRERQAVLVAKLGVDVPLPTNPPPEIIADYLVVGLTAMVRARLRIGDQASLVALQASVLSTAEEETFSKVFGKELAKTVSSTTAREMLRKRVLAPRRQEPDNFELPLGLPEPDELAKAAARLVRNALFGADGRVHPVFPATPDRLPTVVSTEGQTMPPTIEERLVLSFNVEPLWRWEHAFYGEPLHPFDGHEALDGLETTDRESDPALANDGGWPPTPFLYPDDHDGCTCEWVVAVDHG